MAMNNTNSKLNLDRLAAKHAQQVISRTQATGRPTDVENTIIKALGVLQENGVYACALFLKSCPSSEKERADAVMDEMLNLLNALGFGWGKPVSVNAEVVLKHISDKVTANLERLLLAKETLEQMLIYARYGAKARID
jgi:hypothetical protein